MNPARFGQSNLVMLKPKGLSEAECSDIHAFRDGKQVITCWRPTPEEQVKIAQGQCVWLYVLGDGMPPVFLSADDPFSPPSSDSAPPPSAAQS